MSIESKIKIFLHSLMAVSLIGGNLINLGQNQYVEASTNQYCHFSQNEIERKEQLLQASIEGDFQAKQEYDSKVKEHQLTLQQCRQRNWPREQAIWLRLYPCDVQLGSIDYVLDRIVNLGYNQIHLEVFYNGQVLLPNNDNPTPWQSVIQSPNAREIDLLQQAIDKGHQRGLKVYAWLFTLNYGYDYASKSGRNNTLALNGRGENSLNFYSSDRDRIFVDPYNRKAQEDYYRLVQAVLTRKPDGILFDYIRYPRGTGTNSSVNNVHDLWIYGQQSLETLLSRANNNKGRTLIQQYLRKGKITSDDIAKVNNIYPHEGEPSWQGRATTSGEKSSLNTRKIQNDLWFLAVAHAAQGIIDFLSFAASPAQNRQIPAGAVFFPDANRLVGRGGFDSRLQAWDKFPSSLEWHPMAYSICQGTDCIVNEVRRVLQSAKSGTKITPALAGVWGSQYRNHPSLETQMWALRQSVPQINSVSHFAYSWQEPEIDRRRKFCNLP